MDVRILLSHQIKTLALTYYLRLPWSLSAAYDRMDHFFFLEIQIFFDFCGTICLNFFYFQSLLLSTCSVGSSSSTFPLSVGVPTKFYLWYVSLLDLRTRLCNRGHVPFGPFHIHSFLPSVKANLFVLVEPTKPLLFSVYVILVCW